MTTHLYRASILHFPHKSAQPKDDYIYIKDGALVTRNGKIVVTGERKTIENQYHDVKTHDYSGQLIVPGFIDSHLHFPQTEMLASFGEQLLDWLENYTFPTEGKFSNPEYAAKIADIFLRQLYRHGTTSAMVYSSVHQCAAEALFSAAQKHKMLLIAGKVCMDRHCPSWLQDSPEKAQKESADLIERWHGKDRLYYAITPRFAPTSSPEQLHALGELAQQYPDVYIQTHLNENLNEIAWVNSLFPKHNGYLDVYDKFNMLRPKAVFGHCIHMQEHEWQRMAQSGASIAFCPTSNLFLGSGLFDLKTAEKHNIPVALATDVGAGTSFSMLRTLGEAYKVGQLRGEQLQPLHGLYLMTQGAALAQGLEDKIGNLNPGSDADFVVLDPNFDELTSLRFEQHNEVQDIIFALSMLADDRAISATYIAGEPVYQTHIK
ncbi:guanine deaminase [Paraglaciecola polaris]|uniref:Guanine deaminase n=2 Tax=Paraglaciecola polaris TaxID=222814 RepID=K6ZV16_9ALTE|nr:guanine deaminase [Paraglaciecola polaris]GAC32638.1 guanine deaminase [Paraglaciecola polaris LMG 21857]|tara:strand:- start:281 stop:1579 length:1299 start_codon:yes stop_codon:yes gene_type:complete